ncbi:MAG TPA: hypothetical protein VFU99_00675 [Gaiellaceae bacterium]|nr:hypothetical protein [Gaiellaceae bacterium]
MSWFEPVQHGHASAGKCGLDAGDDSTHLVRVEVGVREHEREGEIELVAVRSEVPGPLLDVERVRLAEDHARWLVRLREHPPVPQDRVRLGPEHRVEALDPEPRNDRVVPKLLVLHDRLGDVDAEAGDSTVEPESEYAVELGPDLGVPPVQVGLLRREVVQVVAPALGVESPRRPTAEDRLPVVRYLVGPDVEVRALAEPRVLIRGVVGDEVEEDANSARPRLRHQPVEVGERPEIRVDADVVRDVVAPVDVRRGVNRIQPDPVDAQPLDVLESLGDAGEVSDAVAVRVGERPRIDLVQNRISPPALAHGPRP